MAERHNVAVLCVNPTNASTQPLYYAAIPSSNVSKIPVFEYAKRTEAILMALNCVSTFDGTSISVDNFIEQVNALFNAVAMDEDLYVRLLIVNRLRGRAFEVIDRCGVVLNTVDSFVNTLLHAFKYTSNVRTVHQ